MTNLGLMANRLILMQSLLSILCLTLCQVFQEADLLVSVIAYLLPAVLVYLPIIYKMTCKLFLRRRLVNLKHLRITSEARNFWGLNVLSSIFLGADYFFVAHHLSGSEVVSYHFMTRVFFFSYIIYFSYIQHSIKKLTLVNLRSNISLYTRIIVRSIKIGLVFVILTALSVMLIYLLNGFSFVLNQQTIAPSLFFGAVLYFLIRVIRDVGLVVLWNLGVKATLYKIYLLEVVLGFFTLTYFSRLYGDIGIFLALSLTVFMSGFFIMNSTYKFLRSNSRC